MKTEQKPKKITLLFRHEEHMLGRLTSTAIIGLDAERVDVECDIMLGLPFFAIVGLPDKAVEEAKERVRAALKNSGVDYPTHRIVVNLAPAILRKAGPSYDLPIALSILIASGQAHPPEDGIVVMGELSLDGTLRPVRGVLASVLAAKRWAIPRIFLPRANLAEAQLVEGVEIYPVDSLKQLIDHFRHEESLVSFGYAPPDMTDPNTAEVDLCDIAGQEQAKRGLEIAAAGGHNLLLTGPPGSGKTLLAKALAGILPELSFEEQLEVTAIHSIAGLLAHDQPLIKHRPVRTPHHTSSYVSLTGGGAWPRPGEISLAHRGVLFLDEIAEFSRQTLESLRQPLEDRRITVARAAMTLNFPADISLVASANPCPCGFSGDPSGRCSCSPGTIVRYQQRLSGPFLDRIDLHSWVGRLSYGELTKSAKAEPTAIVRPRVQLARDRQGVRFNGTTLRTNAEMGPKEIQKYCALSKSSHSLVKEAMDKTGFSARTLHRIIKTARTIADLDGDEQIQTLHIAEALYYRLDRTAEKQANRH